MEGNISSKKILLPPSTVAFENFVIYDRKIYLATRNSSDNHPDKDSTLRHFLKRAGKKVSHPCIHGHRSIVILNVKDRPCVMDS